MLILKASALQMRMDRLSGKFLFCLCFELLRLQKQGEQLSLLDKREYPQGEGVSIPKIGLQKSK